MAQSPLVADDVTRHAPDTAQAVAGIGAHYRRHAGESYHESQFRIPQGAMRWVSRLRAKKFQAHVKASDVVAEYGVGHGWNLAGLTCARRIGFDISDTVEEVVRAHGIEFAPVWDMIAPESVDVVICHHVLEHVPQPLDALIAMRRALKPGGLLLLVVPHERERRLNRFDIHEPNRHIYSWNVQSIGNLVHLSGFAIESTGIHRYGYDRAAAVRASRFGVGEWGYHLIRSLALLVGPGREIMLRARRSVA